MKSYLGKNILVRVSSFNAVGVFVKLVTGLISTKVVAILLGAEGMALLGNLRNVLSSVQSVGTLGLYNGVVKYISEHKTNKEELIRMLSTAYFICFVVTMSLAGWLYFDASFWNNLIFGELYHYEYVFEALGIALPFYSANALCMAIINGFSKYKVYILINIVSSILGLCITLLLIWEFRLEGAFMAVIVNPAISLLITLVIIMNQKNFVKLLWANKISSKYVKRFSSYAIMALLPATVLPMVFIRIRNFIINNGGVEEAGYWEAMCRISNQYMLFITTLLTLYLLPKLSEIKRSRLFKLEVLNFYKIILPVFIALFIGIYLFREAIIKILFSEGFISMEPLFIWQLIGDIFKIASLTIAYQFLAKKMFWYYMVTEVFSICFLYISSIYLIDKYGFLGASMAHFFNQIFYFLILLIVFSKSFFGPDRNI